MTISSAVIRHIVSGTSSHLRRDLEGVSFTLVCTVEEGAACRFGGGSWNDPALLAVCERLIHGIGWKRLEYAAGRQAVVRCTAAPDRPASATCHIDLGDGWEPLPVSEG
jgi:hypothetical protein